MPNLIGKTFLLIIIIWIGLVTVACDGKAVNEDIAPVGKAQTVPDLSATGEPISTPTNLPAEIPESISPISPVSPVREPNMAPSDHKPGPLPGSEAAIAAATSDLAKELGVSPNEIRLVSVESVEWNDASLGCPQEGFMYAQVITPGYRVIFEAAGQQYEYHTNAFDNVVLCKSP